VIWSTEHPKKFRTPYLFLNRWSWQLQIWCTTSVWGVRYNNNFSTKRGRGWLRYRSTSKCVTRYHVACTM